MLDVVPLIGVPYLELSSDPEKGLDCYGLLLEVYRRAGRSLEMPRFDYDENDSELILRNAWRHWDPIDFRDFGRPLDVAVFRMAGRYHILVSIGNRDVIHSKRDFGVCIEPWSRYREFAVSVYRHRREPARCAC